MSRVLWSPLLTPFEPEDEAEDNDVLSRMQHVVPSTICCSAYFMTDMGMLLLRPP